MLSRISLQGFRSCVDTTVLELAPLTILAGANNAGKSSFVGAILSLFQSAQAVSRDRLLLSGEWVDLGPFSDLLSPDRHDGFTIGIEGFVDGDEVSVTWEFVESANRTRPEARVRRIDALIKDTTFFHEASPDDSGSQLLHPGMLFRSSGPIVTRLLPFEPDRVLSVGPYRTPPTLLSPFRSTTAGSLVGRYGEYAAEVFSDRRDQSTDIWPPTSAVQEDTLARAMDAWWSYILNDEISLRVSEEGRFGLSVRLDTSGISGRSFGQVGFGLSQLWPILVACLASRIGDLVIIETPEAHLHPGAQHRVARLFTELARHGRQVVVETHSEHVVAAACLAVKQASLEPSQLALSFFSQTKGVTRVERIDVDGSGRRLSSPEGFFDQSSEELLALLGGSA